ncbi:MAG: ATP synthase F0 subunit B [Polyangiaceae bacterium]|nr:ATP synthase F0 subunit B [Polyangiaceae bacterium]
MSRTHLLPALLAALAIFASGPAWAEKSAPHAPPGAGAGAHAPAAGEADAHGGGHGADHGPGPINWYYGMLAETDTHEPNLLFRPKGMQPPLGAMLLNTGILFYVIYRFGKRPLAEAVKKRKAAIMQGMDDAARMKEEAADRLAEYEEKLEHVDEEIERLKREMREAGEAERARILAEAKERSLRMERESRLLIEQELKAARQALVREAVEGAVKSAGEILAREIGPGDHARMADEYLAGLDQAVISKGGQA